jgi:hypothetical protein
MNSFDEVELSAKLQAATEEIVELKTALRFFKFNEAKKLLRGLFNHKKQTGICPICGNVQIE